MGTRAARDDRIVEMASIGGKREKRESPNVVRMFESCNLIVYNAIVYNAKVRVTALARRHATADERETPCKSSREDHGGALKSAAVFKLVVMRLACYIAAHVVFIRRKLYARSIIVSENVALSWILF